MGFFFNQQFIGHPPNTVSEYHTSDDEDRFLKNLEIRPKDWIWRNKKIIYKHNKHGHRCENPEDIDLNNYILFVGCSHTEGIGLPIEETYSYLVAKELNTDYYNMGLAGAGNDSIEYNLLTWLSTVSKKPRLIVIQPTSMHRYMTVNNHYIIEDGFGVKPDGVVIHPRGAWDRERTSRRLVDKLAATGIDTARLDLSIKIVEEIVDVPVIYFLYSQDKRCDPKIKTRHPVIKGHTKDQARDQDHDTNVGHCGPISNKSWAKQIVETYRANASK